MVPVLYSDTHWCDLILGSLCSKIHCHYPSIGNYKQTKFYFNLLYRQRKTKLEFPICNRYQDIWSSIDLLWLEHQWHPDWSVLDTRMVESCWQCVGMDIGIMAYLLKLRMKIIWSNKEKSINTVMTCMFWKNFNQYFLWVLTSL